MLLYYYYLFRSFSLSFHHEVLVLFFLDLFLDNWFLLYPLKSYILLQLPWLGLHYAFFEELC